MLLEFGFVTAIKNAELFQVLVCNIYPFDSRSESETVFEFECVVRIDIEAVGIIFFKDVRFSN